MSRFRFYKQRDAMHCGVASLAMACSQLGRTVDIGLLEEYCCPTNQGVSLKGLSDAAERIGLKAQAVRASTDYLQDCRGPVILHWNCNHFVLLRSVSKNGKRFRIADPAKGVISLSREEFEKHWISTVSSGRPSGIALLLDTTDEFFRQKREEAECRQKEGRGNPFRFMMRYIGAYRKHFAAIILGLAVGCLLQLVLPFLTQAIVDHGIARSDISLIWLILIGELLIVCGRAATDFIRRRLLLHISMRINISLVSDFFIKLLKLPMSFFDTKLTGDLLQRMSDHQRVQSFLTGQTLSILFTALSFIVFGIVLLIYNPLIFGVFLSGSIVYGIWISTFLKRRKVLDYELFEQQAVNQNKTYRFITSMQEIKLQDCESRRRWEWEDVQLNLFDVQMKSLRLQQSQEAGSILINEMKNILITVLSATAVINGQLTLGGMLAIQFIVGQLNSPVEQFMGFIYSMQDVKISLERINEIHDRRNEDMPEACTPRDCAPADGVAIRLSGLDFRYDRHSPLKTLDSVSLDIPEGKVTAIVGASGSGKTTLLKLMLGYYPAENGLLTVNGTDIRNLNMKQWRKCCGTVMQDGIIFSDSIARNIAVSDPEADPDRLEQAARIACLHDTVMSMPLRYNTLVGPDGIGLSQGQKQRILIARAVYKNPGFIFLDEATNSLDAKNEREIVGNLREFYKGKTVLIVAHRLSTVRDADNIIVLEAGRIAEQGTHTDLVARRGHYYSLIKNQLELGS